MKNLKFKINTKPRSVLNNNLTFNYTKAPVWSILYNNVVNWHYARVNTNFKRQVQLRIIELEYGG